MIYLDNAAGSFPKPPEVIEAVMDCLANLPASPGRGQHKMALKAGRIVLDTRRAVAGLLNVSNPADIIFTGNATEALNLAINGWVRSGDTVITTKVEHNSVYRPLAKLAEERGVIVEFAECDQRGYVDIADWRRKLRPGVRLAVFSHTSNVLGAIQPLADLIEIAKHVRVPVLVDAAQSLGAIEVDAGGLGVDMLAFAGHKALLGPQGTGGLFISPDLDIAPLKTGGTGSVAKGPQPSGRPDRYESGTYNTPGLAGLGAAVGLINKTTVPRIQNIEHDRMQTLLEGLREISGVKTYGPEPGLRRASLVSLNLRGVAAQELAGKLDKEYDIYVRAGWMCAPEPHRLIGTYDTGVLRLSPGYFSTDDDVAGALAALKEIVHRLRAV